MYYSFMGDYPIPNSLIPDRIRLSSGLTKTDRSTFTEEDIADAGWIKVPPPPNFDNLKERLIWNREWIVELIPLEEKIKEVNLIRDQFLKEIDWRIERNERETRLGLETTENLEDILKFEKRLMEIEKQENYPYRVSWLPISKNTNISKQNLTF